MGTRPGLRSIPHISGILLLMQLLLLQPLVDAKAETSAAVDTRSAPASPARVTDFKQETEAHEYRVSITFEGNPHHRGKEKMMRKKEKKKMKKKKKRKRQGRIPMLRGPRLTQGAGPPSFTLPFKKFIFQKYYHFYSIFTDKKTYLFPPTSFFFH